MNIKYLLFFLTMLFFLPISEAQNRMYGSTAINNMLKSKNTAVASSMLKSDVALLLAKNNFDSLLNYVELSGEIAAASKPSESVKSDLYLFAEQIKSHHPKPAVLIDVYKKIADFFEERGAYKNCYEAYENALGEADLAKDSLEIASCEYNLGVHANHLGNIALSREHQRKALLIRERNRKTSAEDFYFSYNAVAAIMWYASKYDSANYYYQKAFNALKKMPANELNKYYRKANIYNNIAALYSAEGKTTEAIKAMHAAINNFQQFIAKAPNHQKVKSATEGVYEGIDNLAGIYKEVGDYRKAGYLLRYSYQQKKKLFATNHPGIFISELLLGQYFNSVNSYDSAKYYLKHGLDKLEKANGDYLFWAGDGYYSLALVYENTNDTANAAIAYSKAIDYYDKSYQNTYDNIYMDVLRHVAVFYAAKGDYTKATHTAIKVLKYLRSTGEAESLQTFYQLLNIAEINYLSQHYKRSIENCNKALTVINKNIEHGNTRLDSIKMEVFKPKAILTRSKSLYALQKKKDVDFLKNISNTLDDALNILNERKILMDDPGILKLY